MKNYTWNSLLMIILGVLYVNITVAQPIPKYNMYERQGIKCVQQSMTDAYRASKGELDSKEKEKSESLEKFTTEFLKNRALQKNTNSNNPVITVPIVFHVVHDGGVENVDDNQILSALQALNEDFRGLNPDTASVHPDWVNLVSDTQIDFCLATLDPDGNPTTGITRNQDSFYTYDGRWVDMKILYGWPRDQYLNVYIVNNSDGSNGSGFAYYPSDVSDPWGAWDGVVLSHWAVGTQGTSYPGYERVISHEVGHWLNLYHIWGPGNFGICGDSDLVDDTPECQGYWGTCDPNYSSCGSLDMTQNLMDYSYCTMFYTPDQTSRMQAALYSPISYRSGIWSDENLIATGCLTGPPAVVAAFEADKIDACQGETLQFTDLSTGTPTEWHWYFEGGTPMISNDQNPTVTYTDPGIYEVSLIVMNADGSDTEIKKRYLNLQCIELTTKVFLQGAFDSATNLMRDDLRVKNYVPLMEPYNDLVNFTHMASGGNEVIDTSVLKVTGNDAIVDWVLLELRDSINAEQIISTRAALVQRDGDVVDVDGVSPVLFKKTPDISFYLACRHRNHLGLMSQTTVSFRNQYTAAFDFTDVNAMTYGQHSKLIQNNTAMLWSGNTNMNGSVIFQGLQNDCDNVLLEVLGMPLNTSFSTNYIIQGYKQEDIDMSGEVIYQGLNNDLNPVFFNILSHPNNTSYLTNFIIQEQLP